MINYFIDGLTAEQLAALIAAGITFVEFDNKGIPGILVSNQKDIIRLYELLEMEAENLEPTEFVGIQRVVLQKRKTPLSGEFATFEGKKQRDFSFELLRLAYILNKNVVGFVPHGTIMETWGETGKIKVFIWASPENKGLRRPPGTLWNIPVEARDHVFLPTGNGIQILEGEYVVAEIIGNHIYIHHDACHYGAENEILIFRRILLECAKALGATDESIAAAEIRYRKEQEHAYRGLYVTHCSRYLKEGLASLKVEIEHLNKEARRHQENLTAVLRKSDEKMRLQKFFTAEHTISEAKAMKEFEAIMRVKGVHGLEMRESGIHIYTDTLYCIDPRSKKRHEIGKFRIHFAFSDEYGNGTVRFYNLTRQIDGCNQAMQSPHCNNNGDACLGTIKEILPQLIARLEYAAATALAIEFLESVNVDDNGGKFIHHWPLAPEEVTVTA